MSIGIIILFIALIPALWRRSGTFALLWLLGSGLMAFEYMQVLFSWSVQDYIVSFPLPIGEANIGLNRLSAFFGVIFSLGLPLGILYGHYYLKAHTPGHLRTHLVALGVLGLSMHGVLWMRHGLLFVLVWELMSISSFLCIIYDGKSSFKAALNYLITMQIGAAFLMAAFALLYYQTGSFDFDNLYNMPRLPLYLLLIGFSFKAGFVPFASWLPLAHPVAPAHVSGIMSALMIKTGIYGILLLFGLNIFSLPEILVFTVIAVISAFWGVIHAMISLNIKRALAYSSIENIGIIGIGLCLWLLGMRLDIPKLATLALAGALMHIFFHSLFKALLFYLSGNIQLAAGSLEMNSLGGLAKKLRTTAVFSLLGTFAISALPIGNGFISEFSLYFGLLSALPQQSMILSLFAILLLGSLAFVGALALIAFARLFGISFLGTARSDAAIHTKKLSRGLYIPQAILACGILLTGLLGNLTLRFTKPLIRWLNMEMDAIYSLSFIYRQLSIVLLLLLAIFLLLYLLRRTVVKESRGNTWGCGFQKPNPRMQYSSLAFSHPLSYFLQPFILLRRKLKKAEGLYPQELSLEDELQDPVYRYITQPLTRALNWIYALFSKIAQGNSNAYVAWSLGFLLLLIIWIMGFK